MVISITALLGGLAMSTQGAPAVSQPPAPPAGGIHIGAYPAGALRRSEEGSVRFEAVIGTDGTVTRCTVTQKSGSSELDDATCDAIRKTRGFTPAKDANGKAIEARFSSSVKWVIPRRNTAPVPGELAYSFIVEKDGTAHDCKVTRALGEDAVRYTAGTPPCPVGKYGLGYLGADGKPERKRVTIRQTIAVENADESRANGTTSPK